MTRFAERFAQWGFRKTAIAPVYGLAEAGLGVTFPELQQEPVVTEFDRDKLSTEASPCAVPAANSPPWANHCPAWSLRFAIRTATFCPKGMADASSSTTLHHQRLFQRPRNDGRYHRSGWLAEHGRPRLFLRTQPLYRGRAKDLIILRGATTRRRNLKTPSTNWRGCASAARSPSAPRWRGRASR